MIVRNEDFRKFSDLTDTTDRDVFQRLMSLEPRY